jgi:F-type H+-transporting ATPase subunit b
MHQAEEDARAHREHLSEQARDEVERQQSRWSEELRREQQAFLERLRREAGEQVCQIARRSLADLAEVDLEARMVETFVRRLGELAAGDREELIAAIREAGNALTVTSAFDLPDELRDRLSQALHQHVLPDVQIRFDRSPELVCGIKAKAAGREIAWTVAGYLRDLLDHMNATFAEEAEEAGDPGTAHSSGPAVEETP